MTRLTRVERAQRQRTARRKAIVKTALKIGWRIGLALHL